MYKSKNVKNYSCIQFKIWGLFITDNKLLKVQTKTLPIKEFPYQLLLEILHIIDLFTDYRKGVLLKVESLR